MHLPTRKRGYTVHFELWKDQGMQSLKIYDVPFNLNPLGEIVHGQAEKRINHPQEMVKVGQPVKAQVLAIDKEKRQLRLGMKQMVPTSLDEYIAEHKPGDVVSGRITEISGERGSVELGEGIHATCRITASAQAEKPKAEAKADLSSLSSMLQARWKSGAPAAGAAKQEPPRAGQIRRFKIAKLDQAGKKIELELAE